MAEVLQALTPDRISAYPPFRWLQPEQKREVQEAVGEMVMIFVDLEMEVPSYGDFLVEVSPGLEIAYSFDMAGDVAEAYY